MHSQREAYMDLVENGSGGRPSEIEEPKESNKFTYSHVSRPISHIVLGH